MFMVTHFAVHILVIKIFNFITVTTNSLQFSKQHEIGLYSCTGKAKSISELLQSSPSSSKIRY